MRSSSSSNVLFRDDGEEKFADRARGLGVPGRMKVLRAAVGLLVEGRFGLLREALRRRLAFLPTVTLKGLEQEEHNCGSFAGREKEAARRSSSFRMLSFDITTSCNASG